MIMGLYSIKDKIGREFGPIMESKNDDTALRKFNSIEFPVSKDDFALFRVGIFDHESGKVSYFNPPVLVEVPELNNPVLKAVPEKEKKNAETV